MTAEDECWLLLRKAYIDLLEASALISRSLKELKPIADEQPPENGKAGGD